MLYKCDQPIKIIESNKYNVQRIQQLLRRAFVVHQPYPLLTLLALLTLHSLVLLGGERILS